MNELTPGLRNEQAPQTNAEVRFDLHKTSSHLDSYEKGRETAAARLAIEKAHAEAERPPRFNEILGRQSLNIVMTRRNHANNQQDLDRAV